MHLAFRKIRAAELPSRHLSDPQDSPPIVGKFSSLQNIWDLRPPGSVEVSMREIEGSAGGSLPNQVGMNVVQPERLVLPADDENPVPSVGDTANPGELKNDLEKYEHLKELAELFFATKRRHPQAPAPAKPC